MDDFTKFMVLMGKGMWGGTKLMLSGVKGAVEAISGKNSPERDNQQRKGITQYRPSEIGGFFPPEEMPENTVISGGDDRIRAETIEAFCRLSAYHQIPVVVLHCNDHVLEQYMADCLMGTGVLGMINDQNPCYEPFWQKQNREIGQMILESAPKDYEMKTNLRSYLDGMCGFLQAKGARPTYQLMSTCPHGQMFARIDHALLQGKISQDQAQDVKMHLMAGQNDYYKIENYFYDLDAQIGRILWRRQAGMQTAPVNILSTLDRGGILLIDVGSVSCQLVLNLMLAEIRIAIQQGKRLTCVMDSLDVADNEYLKKMMEQNSSVCKVAVASRDVFAGCNADEKLFHTILGKSMKNIIFSHASNVSATKWAEGIGSYDKMEVSHSYSKSKSTQLVQLFPTTTTGESTSVSMKREYIVKPEEILRMGNREAYIYTKVNNELAHTVLQ